MDDLLDEVKRFELSPHLRDDQKVALRLHETFLTDPAGLSDEVRDDTLTHFSPEQIVELTFKYVWWSTNRPNATIGPDDPHDSSRLTSYHYSEEGEYIVDPVADPATLG